MKDIYRRGGIEAAKTKKEGRNRSGGGGWIDDRKKGHLEVLSGVKLHQETVETAERRVRHKEIKKKQMGGEGEYRV